MGGGCGWWGLEGWAACADPKPASPQHGLNHPRRPPPQAADRAPLGQEAPGEEGAVGVAGRKTLETLGAADEIIEALDLAADEEERQAEHAADKQRNPRAKPPVPNPLLLGRAPSAHVLHVVARVRSAELEQALLLLPFTDALRLVGYLLAWLRQGGQVRRGAIAGEGGSARGKARERRARAGLPLDPASSAHRPPHWTTPPAPAPARRWSCCAAWPRCCCGCTCSS